MRVVIEGWEQSVPVRAVLDTPDANQVRAAERVTLEFDVEDIDDEIEQRKETNSTATTITTRVILHQQPHLLARSPPLLSACVWDCGLALAEWMVERESKGKKKNKGKKVEKEGLTIVELGAGAGASGLAAAAAPSGFARFVLLTDVAAALRGLRSNLTRNRLGEKVAVEEIDWLSNPLSSGDDRGKTPLEVFRDTARASSSSSSSEEAKEKRQKDLLYPDLVLSADVCYPPPPSASQKGDSAALAQEAEASAVAWAKAAASLCGPETRVVVAFEKRPRGIPPPELLLEILMREASKRFERIEKLDASGLAFAGAGHLELFEFSGKKREGVE